MPLRLLLAGLLTALWCAVGGFALAQTALTPEVDYDTWEVVAEQAERTLSSGAPTDAQLERLRARLVTWRTTFLEVQSADRPRIASVQEQIEALGPAPAEGETEAPEIAARRTELVARLAELRAPRLDAELAYGRADGLIAELDAMARARTARQLSELGPSPLSPSHWRMAVNETALLGRDLTVEVQSSFAARRDITRADALRAIFFLIMALALLLRGRRWVVDANAALGRKLKDAVRGVSDFVVSLGQVAVPILGIYALMEAVASLDILGPQGLVLINTLPIIGLAGFGGAWLGRRLFPADPEEVVALALTPRQRAELRILSAGLGLLLGLEILAGRVGEMANFSPAAQAVLLFPIFALAGMALVRAGQILLQYQVHAESAEAHRFIALLAALMGRLAMLLGGVGLLASAIGYLNAARAILFPTALSLAVIGLLAVLFFLIRDLYGFLRRESRDEADQSLVPVLLSFALTISSIPLFALIWGARVTDIGEVMRQIGEGVAIGQTRVTATDVLTLIVVFAVIYGLTRIFQSMLRSTVLPKTRLDTGGQNAISSGIGYLGILLAGIVAVTSAGIDLSNLALLAGALSVGIGFGLQNVVSNFVSGIILLIERPVGEGDWIEVGDTMGVVKAISVRSTRIETFDRTDVIVPNADLVSGTVTNWTKGNLMGRVTLKVGVAYGSDSRRVEAILREICENHPLVAVDPAPAIYFASFGADALEFDCYCILLDVTYIRAVQSELNHQVHARFRAEGIEIPFAQRDLWLRNPETLHHPPPPDKAAKVPAKVPAAGAENARPPNQLRAPDTWDDD